MGGAEGGGGGRSWDIREIVLGMEVSDSRRWGWLWRNFVDVVREDYASGLIDRGGGGGVVRRIGRKWGGGCSIPASLYTTSSHQSRSHWVWQKPTSMFQVALNAVRSSGVNACMKSILRPTHVLPSPQRVHVRRHEWLIIMKCGRFTLRTPPLIISIVIIITRNK